ncbi:alcohol dehydrogenase, zinc-binding [Luminiphilus syltensis NOR5-1B]|uniref:Alcohol dehydrogenase, zinc-binding n=1 Tax=Luminiphilus syltensis NOR5-1B TaxID=565045 RepID=B8KTN0_9GAMM|nr:NAD(P)H-quinone oxidoreductase [Luminiphilus syltensis]EED36982.1 alcohol dehydrogenase, zinc-binding [Luminiphilus syltensis NOR5-1B]
MNTATQRTFAHIEDDQSVSLHTDAIPTPSNGEVLIEVAFAGINRADLLQRKGLYPAPADASPVMGLEVSGIVLATGDDVDPLKVGDKVCALTHGGGYASHCIARADHCISVPENLSLEQAAALPEALLTVWSNVFVRAGFSAGERLLMSGGTSGIGTLGIQMAVAMGGEVVSIAGSDEKCEMLRQLGCKAVINYRDQDLREAFDEAGYSGKIDVVLDMVGGDFTSTCFDLAAVDGRIVCIGIMGGVKSQINLATLFMKRLTLTGSTLRRLSTEDKTQAFIDIRTHIVPLIAEGRIQPVIHATYPLAAALEAQEAMQTGTHTGKLLLDCQIDLA